MKKKLQRIMIVVLAVLLASSGLLVPDKMVSAALGNPNNLLLNPSFEADGAMSVVPSGWSAITTGGTVKTQSGGTEVGYSAKLTSVTRTGSFDNPSVGIYQSFTGLEQGTYTLTAKIRTNNPNPSSVSLQEAAFIEAKNTGAPTMRAFVNLFAANNTDWVYVYLRNVIVYNGEATIGIYLKDAVAGMTLEVDEVQFYMEHSDRNPVQNWGFETGNTASWVTSGNVNVESGQADSGTYAARLEAGAKIAQQVAVKPNTDYIATVRAKVSDSSNRIRIGVDGIQEKRSAPSATTNYSLLPLSFRTGTNETSATIYIEQTAEGGGYGYADSIDVFEISNDIVKGVDVSYLLLVEDYGGKYKANGVEQDFFDIIRNRGVNAVASMFFVEAGNYIYEESDWKQYQAGLRDDLPEQTYTTTYINDLAHLGTKEVPLQMWPGYFGKEQALELAQRAKAHGMKFELSLHYSDTWMSSGKAWKPLAWFGQNMDQLQTTMYNYTYDLVKSLVDAGVAPDSVKLGNEQNSGIAWPDGKIWSTGRDGFAKLVNASYQAVKDASPTTRGYLHLNNGYYVDYTNQWFGVNENIGMEWDGEAYSLYGGRPTGSIIDMLNNNLTKWAGKDVIFSETGLMHTNENYDPRDNGSGMKNSYYEVSQRGQYNWLIEYMQAFRDVPNPHGAQLGFFYWAADWIAKGDGHEEWFSPWLPGTSTSQYGNSVDSRTLFTYDGHVSDGMYAYLWRGKASSKELGGRVSHNWGSNLYEVTPTEAESISVSAETLQLREGQSQQIVATVQPVNQFVYTNMKWETSNSSVAQVNKQGIVTAVGPGTATITVRLGELTASTEVVVTATQLAQSLAFTSPNMSSGSLDAIVGDQIRIAVNLSEADNRNVIFSSSDPSVASFLGEAVETSNPGVLIQQTNVTTGVTLLVKKDGVSTITVTSADGNASSSFEVQVDKIEIESIQVNSDDFELEKNRTKQLAAIIEPENASFQDVVWESSDDNVATVSENGLVTAVGNGQADITVRAIDGGFTASIKVTVVDVKTKSIALDHELIRLRAGENTVVGATVLPTDATNPTVEWISSDTSVFTVDNGVITAIADGSATLTVRALDGGAEASIDVVIADTIPVESVAIDQGEVSLTAGLTATLAAVIQPSSADNKEVTWSSSDESVATVDQNGLVIAKSKGQVTITVTATDGGLTGASIITVDDELQQHYVSTGSNRTRAATPAEHALDNNPATGWTPGAYRANQSDIWWVDLGQLAEIDIIDMLFFRAQRYNVSVSESNTSIYAEATNFTKVVDHSSQFSDAVEVSHSLPTGTKARWIKVEVFEASPQNQWLYIREFKAHGRFLTQVTDVTLNTHAATVIMGDSYQLQATVTPSYAPQELQWSTSDATLATVDENGNVTTYAHDGIEGESKSVTITATASNGVTASAVIDVKSPIIVEAISLYRHDNQPIPGGGLVLEADATVDLDVSIFQGDAAYRSVIWKSTHPEISSVDAETGLVTAHQPGIAEISVEVDSYSNLPGGFVFKDSISVIVQEEDETPTIPTPTGLQAGTITADAVQLSWHTVNDVDGYNVYRAASADGEYMKVNTALLTSASYTDNGLNAATTYYYKVTAVQAAGESLQSAFVAATTTSGGSQPSELNGGGSLTGPAEAYVGRTLDLTVGLDSLTGSFTILEAVVNYDPQKVGFDTLEHEGKLSLAESAWTVHGDSLQVLGTAVKPAQGQLYIILGSLGTPITEAGALFTLHSGILEDADVGTLHVSLSDFGISFEAESALVDVTDAWLDIEVKLADKALLASKISEAQQLYSQTTQGSAPGQYPASARTAFYNAIGAAEEVNGNPEATQDEVELAITALSAAITTYRNAVNPDASVDKAALQTAIAAAQAKLERAVVGSKVGQYSQSAKDGLTGAIQSAQAINSSGSVSQYQVDQAVQDLNSALQTFSNQVITLVPGSGKVTIKDLSFIAKYYGVTSADVNWNEIEKADLFDQGRIDIVILAAIAQMILDDWLMQ